MKKKSIEQITEKLIDEDIFDTDGTLTQEELDFLKTNPALSAKLTDTNFIKKKYILVLFFISVFMATAAKTIEYTAVLANHDILHNLLTEVQFSISMEMLGASIIAYFLEILLESRMRKNRLLLQQLTREKTNNKEEKIEPQ